MVCLRLYPDGNTEIKSELGKQVSVFTFNNEDGVVVIAALNIDKEGQLFNSIYGKQI